MSDLWFLDLKTEENPTGSLNTAEMYKHLINARTWGFENFDPVLAWQRRMWAQDAVTILDATTKKTVSNLLNAGKNSSWLETLISTIKSKLFFLGSAKPTATNKQQTASLRWFGARLVQEMAASGKTVDQIIDINWPVAIGGVGVTVGAVCYIVLTQLCCSTLIRRKFADILSFFLKPENATLWNAVSDLAISVSKSEDSSANRQLRQYVLEAQRMTSFMKDVRICQEDVVLDGIKMKKGDKIIPVMVHYLI